MLEPIEGLPDGVIGFEAVGDISATDYSDILRPAVDAVARGGTIRLVYVLGDRFDDFSAGASWQDTKLGLEHRHVWDRVALVSDLDWVRHLTSLVGWMMPGEFKRFDLAELPEAIAWAAGHERST
jgi:hypothetical protein